MTCAASPASVTMLLPHVASGSAHTRQAMADLCVDSLVAWFSTGKPLTPVPETATVVPRQRIGNASNSM